MEVHINFGRHAGEVRDIVPEAALAMLADGRASRPGEIESRVYAPEEIASFVAVRPEELGDVHVGIDLSSRAEVVPARRRSRR